MTWWHDRETLARFVTDLVTAETARLHPALRLPDPPWPSAITMDEEGLGIDSLDRLALANMLAAQLGFSGARAFDRFLQLREFGDWLAAAAEGLSHFGQVVAFYSSGTMGERKLVRHALAALQEETEFLARLAGPAARIAFTVPTHHIYGFLFTILLPARLSCPVLDLRKHSAGSFAGLNRGDLVIAFPLLWQGAAETVEHWPKGIAGVTSTAPCPSELAMRLRWAGLSRLLEIYGSTETGGIGWREAWDQPFELFPYWRRVSDNEIARSINGKLHSYMLPDTPAWQDDRHLLPAGRSDGQVQVGGINVSPEQVCQVLLQHTEVSGALVRLMRPDEGSRLKAFIVPAKPDANLDDLRQSLETWLRERLTAPERPASFTFGPQLPRTSLGKPADWMAE